MLFRSRIWDFIGVEPLEDIIDDDSDGVIQEAALTATEQFHMTASHALEVTNLEKLSRIDIIKEMQNDTWLLRQPNGCSSRRFVRLFVLYLCQVPGCLCIGANKQWVCSMWCSPSQLTPLFTQNRGVSWCGDHGSLEDNQTKFVTELVPTPHRNQFSLDSCTEDSSHQN